VLDWLIDFDFSVFVTQCLSFFFELVGGTLLFACIFPQRKKWGLRLGGFIFGGGAVTAGVICVAFIICSHCDVTDRKIQILGAILAVAYLFFILCSCIAMVRVSFAANVWEAIFCGVCGYSVQHIIYRIDLTVSYYSVFGDNEILRIFFLIFSIATVYAFSYFVFVRKYRMKRNVKVENKRLVLMMGLVLQIMIIFGVFSLSYFGSKEMRETPMVVVESGMSITICLLILFLILDSVKNISLEEENRIIRSMWQADRKQYDISKQNIEQLNIKYHDLKYILRSMGTDEKTQNDIKQCLKLYETLYQTGCEPLDVTLHEKSVLAMRYGITIACIADGHLLEGMEPVHIYSLFGNALDNAVECLKDVSEPEKKLINFTLGGGKGGMIVIQIENYTPVCPEFKDGLPVTTKKDSENHGFGTRSIRNIVERYGGFLNIKVKDNIFTLTVMLPQSLKIKKHI